MEGTEIVQWIRWTAIFHFWIPMMSWSQGAEKIVPESRSVADQWPEQAWTAQGQPPDHCKMTVSQECGAASSHLF